MSRSSLLQLFFLVILVAAPTKQAVGESSSRVYRLGAGDKLQVQVFNQSDLSGDYTVSGDGRFSMPFIGSVRAEGLTIAEVTELIVNRLKPDYLINPRVNIEVLNYRPFYIMGEIKRPDSYPFVEGMSYLNAVAIAQGYTYRAKKGFAMVRRKGDPNSEEQKVEMTDFVQPGDIVRIVERKF